MKAANSRKTVENLGMVLERRHSADALLLLDCAVEIRNSSTLE
jgi:hypothetical protein